MAGASKSPSVVISHPHGNSNVRQACLALAQTGSLHSFWTSLAWSPAGALSRFVPRHFRRQLERRAVPEAVRPFVRLHPWRELGRLGATRLTSSARTPRFLSPNACAESLDRRVAAYLQSKEARGVDVVYAYDHGALKSFRVAKSNGQERIYELPIGYWRVLKEILAVELHSWPEWKDALPDVDFRSSEFERKDEEIVLASCIHVPSHFVHHTLRRQFPSLPPVRVTPYGAPPSEPLREEEIARSASGPLRVLYVGALCLRKGIPYLFSALGQFGDRIESTVVGRLNAPCAPLTKALSRCRWIESLPRHEVLQQMRRSDVFVFPTLFEGMALVVLEAMSQGCVVITTSNAGADELIEDGVNGFIVPARSTHAIVELLERLDRDRDMLQRLRLEASRTSAMHSWEVYRSTLIESVTRVASRQQGVEAPSPRNAVAVRAMSP